MSSSTIFGGVYGRYGTFKTPSFPKGWSYELGYDAGRNFQIKHELQLFNHRAASMAQFQLRGAPSLGARTLRISRDTAYMRFDLMLDRDHQYELKWLARKAQYLPLHRKRLMWDNKIIEHRINRGQTRAAAPWPATPPGWRRGGFVDEEEEYFWNVEDSLDAMEPHEVDAASATDGADNAHVGRYAPAPAAPPAEPAAAR